MSLRVLIVCQHASAQFGGEAALPLHYFRILRARDIPVWLITHSRVQSELLALFPDAADQIRFVKDSWLHRLMWWLGEPLPLRLSYFTTGFVSRLSTQITQRFIAKELIRNKNINIVHQPIPVSPREPSILYGLGVPVVIGPMNGGMDYPPSFRKKTVFWIGWLAALGRANSRWINWLLPGKSKAAILLVANERTRAALPKEWGSRVILLHENGVDLKLWKRSPQPISAPTVPRFVFLGRLVDWKAVDILVEAFDRAASQSPMALTVVGDGPEALRLRDLARQQCRFGSKEGEAGLIYFAGWQSQVNCARTLRASQVLVLPSLWECGGAVVLEAMACELPVIATAWGGPLDYLDEGCGILVQPTTREELVEGMAQAMVQLARDPALRRRMGVAGRTKVERDFDWEYKVDKIIELYQSLVPRDKVKVVPKDAK
jgi:glycosyltransferase involved in cell wall biosynthesis